MLIKLVYEIKSENKTIFLSKNLYGIGSPIFFKWKKTSQKLILNSASEIT